MSLKGRSQRGIFPIIIEIKSIKAAQLEEIKSVEATSFKGTESVHSVSLCDTKSHQPLYLKKILMQKVNKNWEGFNSQIKT